MIILNLKGPFGIASSLRKLCILATLRSESGNRTYNITARRMISGLVLKYLKGERFVIQQGYKAALPASSRFL